MIKNNFRLLYKKFSFLKEEKSELIKEELREPAREINQIAIRWLKERQYTLRDNAISSKRPSSQSPRLYEYQKVLLRKTNKRNSISLTLRNNAPHAKYFFNRTKPHKIEGNPLSFFWGAPWKPLDGKPEGQRFFQYVQHPGTRDYKKLLLVRLDRHSRLLSTFPDNIAKRIINA